MRHGHIGALCGVKLLVGLEAQLSGGALRNCSGSRLYQKPLFHLDHCYRPKGHTPQSPIIDAFLLGPMSSGRRISLPYLPSPEDLTTERTWCILRSLCFPKVVNSHLAATKL